MADLVPSDAYAQLSDSSSRIFLVCVLQSVSSGNLLDRFRLGSVMIFREDCFQYLLLMAPKYFESADDQHQMRACANSR